MRPTWVAPYALQAGKLEEAAQHYTAALEADANLRTSFVAQCACNRWAAGRHPVLQRPTQQAEGSALHISLHPFRSSLGRQRAITVAARAWLRCAARQCFQVMQSLTSFIPSHMVDTPEPAFAQGVGAPEAARDSGRGFTLGMLILWSEVQPCTCCCMQHLAQQVAPPGACRAAVHLKLRNNDQAMKDADLACELDSHYAKAYLRRAAAHTALEQFEEAVRDYEKVTAPVAAESMHACQLPHTPFEHTAVS